MSYKQKLFLNMLIAQAGFAVLSFLAIYNSKNNTGLIILINIVFGAIIAFLQYKAYNNINSGVKDGREFIKNLVDFIFMRVNKFQKVDYDKF